MPKKARPSNTGLQSVIDEVNATYRHALIAKSLLAGFLKENESVRPDWDSLVDQICEIMPHIESEIKRRISN